MEWWLGWIPFFAGAGSAVSVVIAVQAYREAAKDGKFQPRNRTINGDMVGGTYTMGNISISGRDFQGKDISIINDRIYIDGVDVTDGPDGVVKGIVEIKVTGDVSIVKSDRAVTINGNVGGNAESGGSMQCGNVTGSAESSGSMKAGSVGGDAKSGGSMQCGTVAGNVKAGGSVRHG